MSAERMATIGRIANDRRTLRVADKRAIAAGRLSVSDVLEADHWSRSTVLEALAAQRGWGNVKARKLAWQVQMSELKLCGELTERQRTRIREMVA